MALKDLLAPPAIGFQSRHIVFGDLLAKAMVLVGYPRTVKEAWLSRLAGMPGVVVSLHLEPTDPYELLKSLNSSIQEYSSRLLSGGQALVQSRWQQSLDDAKALLKKIDQESQAVYSVVVVVLITATTEEELQKKSRQVEAACASAGMRARAAVFRQEAGLLSAGPFGQLSAEIAQLGSRTLPAETVAAAYPWISSGLNHGKGIVLGRDSEDGLILVDRWNPPDGTGITNPNMNILGTSGGGKSFAAKLFLLREYAMGSRILVLDPEREYLSICKDLGGSWINAAGGSGKLNPLEIRPMPDLSDDDVPESDSTRGPLSQHLQRVKTFFQLYLPGLSDVERAVLDDAVRKSYFKYGVDWHTDPTTVQKWPTVADVYEFVQEANQERLVVLLRGAVEGADAALWNGQTTIPAAGDFTVLDIRDLTDASDNVRRAQYFNILTYSWDLIRANRNSGDKTVLVVDEAWLLADPQTPQALGFLRDLSKRIRKYNGSLVPITQNIVDFLSPEIKRLGEPVITNASLKLLMRQESKDLVALTDLLRLTEAEVDLLASAKRGEGLLLAGNQRVKVRIEASPAELELLV